MITGTTKQLNDNKTKQEKTSKNNEKTTTTTTNDNHRESKMMMMMMSLNFITYIVLIDGKEFRKAK